MYQKPHRPSHDITQPFNSGIVTFFETYNAAQPGYAPNIELKETITVRYEEIRLGINRYYAAMQNNIQLDRVIRCPQVGVITNQDIAMTEDGTYYRIDQIQTVQDVYPRCVDISLYKVVQDDLV